MEDTFPAGPSWARGLGWSALAALALAAGCTNYIGTTAASFLRKVREDPDPNLRYIAYGKLAQPQCYDSLAQRREAVAVLVEKLEKGNEPVATRAVILNTLGALQDPSARDVVLKFTNDPEAVLRVQACRALGKVGTAEDATVLARIMTVDALEDCRIAAIEALGDLKTNDPRIARMLVAGMKNDDPATRLASLQALRKVTGKDLGTDSVAWEKVLPKEGDAAVSVAAATPPPRRGPAYPPRPKVSRTVVDSAVEMAGKLTARQKASDPAEQGANFVEKSQPAAPTSPPAANAPGASASPYPATNPNLPPP